MFDTQIKQLKSFVEKELPEFVNACKESDMVILHQDAFAGDYQAQEYLLLGMAVKYAGLHGKEVRIIGTNEETIKRN